MDYPKFIVSNKKEESINIYKGLIKTIELNKEPFQCTSILT